MSHSARWWYATLIIVAGSFSGCSQQDGSTSSEDQVVARSSSAVGGGAAASERQSDVQAPPASSSDEAATLPESRAAVGMAAAPLAFTPDRGQQESPAGQEVAAGVHPPTTIDVPGQLAAVSSGTDAAAPQGGKAQHETHRVAGHATSEDAHGDPPGSTPAEREPLFVNWPDPQLAIVLTGRQYGYMEPCGCSGLENQNGGLMRRGTLIQQLRDRGWPVIPVDAGNQVRRFGRQAEIKFQITVESLREMGYQAIGFGPDDLRLPAPELVGVIDTFVKEYNKKAKPFKWVATAESIFEKLKRLCGRISKTAH